MEKEKEQIQLPDNAFTELKPGEEDRKSVV